jgi:hypothetical protein
MKKIVILISLLISTLSFSQVVVPNVISNVIPNVFTENENQLDGEYMERPFNGAEEDTLYYEFLDSNCRLIDTCYYKLNNPEDYYFYDFVNTKKVEKKEENIISPIKKEE